MTLQVPYEDFHKAREQHCPSAAVYLTARSGWSLVTAADPVSGIVVASVSRKLVKVVRDELHGSGVDALDGVWAGGNDVHLPDESADCYVAARELQRKTGPGIWVDAYAHMPTQVQVLRSMFDELCETGELEGTDFDTFVRLANPTVAIVSPREVEGYLERNATREV